MGGKKTATQFKDKFIGRVKDARNRSGFTQEDMAKILGIEQGRYKQYETRSYLPHEFVDVFCTATRISAAWLFSQDDVELSKKRSALDA